jgi:hypothetical protein
MKIDREAIEKKFKEDKAKTERDLLELYMTCRADDKNLKGVTKKNKNRATRRKAIKEFKAWSGYWPAVDDLIKILGIKLNQAERAEIAADLDQLEQPAAPRRLRF